MKLRVLCLLCCLQGFEPAFAEFQNVATLPAVAVHDIRADCDYRLRFETHPATLHFLTATTITPPHRMQEVPFSAPVLHAELSIPLTRQDMLKVLEFQDPQHFRPTPWDGVDFALNISVRDKGSVFPRIIASVAYASVANGTLVEDYVSLEPRFFVLQRSCSKRSRAN